MIRRATAEDAVSILRVHMASIRGLACGEYSAEQVEAWCGDRQPGSYLGPLAEQFVVLAEVQGEVAGFAQLSVARASVEAVYVHPGFARQGIGTQLLRALEAQARACGVRELALQASLNAVPFYAAAGYVPGLAGRHVVGGGVAIPCQGMSRALE